MALNADLLLDRIRLKQQVSRWRLAAIAVAALAALYILGGGAGLSPLKTDYIARITIDEVITDDRDIVKLITAIREDSHAKAAVIWLDTPGGSAVGGQEIYLQLIKLSKTKPTVAVMRNMATSAGYLAALGTDRLVAREGTLTGSIGVIMETIEATELANKLGIKPIIVKSGPNKASPNPLEKYTPAQDAVMQEVIHDFFNWFVDVVAERRKLSRSVTEALADGRIYTGRQALKTGLIDEIGGEDEAIKWLEKEKKISHKLDVRDVKVEKPATGLLDQFTELANGKLGGRLLQRLDGLVSIWQPNSL